MKVPPIGRDLAMFNQLVNNSLDVIFEELGKVQQQPISSYRVLEAIVTSWPTISEVFGL